MTKTSRQLTFAAVAGAALALAACGGNDYNNAGNTPPVTSEVPASASQSIGGFIDYLMKLVAFSDDTLIPVDVAAVTAPTDETSDPTVLP